MPIEFYCEIQYSNFDWKITTITLLRGHKNTQQWQVHNVTATVGKTPPYRLVQTLKICPRKKSYSVNILTMWYWILLNFKNILKFMNFSEF